MVNWTTHCRWCGRPVNPIDSVSLGGNLYHTECCKSPYAKADADVGYITRAECDRLIAEAVEAEREACAKIADAKKATASAQRIGAGNAGTDFAAWVLSGTNILALREVAAAIRARKGGEK